MRVQDTPFTSAILTQSVILHTILEWAMNANRCQKKWMEQVVSWGAQTLAWAMSVREYSEGTLKIKSPDTGRALHRKYHTISQTIWDVTTSGCRQDDISDEAIAKYTASVFAWVEDQIGEVSCFQSASKAFASLKPTIYEAIQKLSSTPYDNEPEEMLRMLAKNLICYLANHNDRYPEDLAQLDKLPKDQRYTIDYDWLCQRIAYLGAGKHCKSNPPDMVIAYDRSMLAGNKGTCVLFNDAHVEHVSYTKAKELGLHSQ